MSGIPFKCHALLAINILKNKYKNLPKKSRDKFDNEFGIQLSESRAVLFEGPEAINGNKLLLLLVLLNNKAVSDEQPMCYRKFKSEPIISFFNMYQKSHHSKDSLINLLELECNNAFFDLVNLLAKNELFTPQNVSELTTIANAKELGNLYEQTLRKINERSLSKAEKLEWINEAIEITISDRDYEKNTGNPKM